MKSIRIIAVLAISIFSVASVFGQDKEARVTKTKVVNASADDVWMVLRQMDDIQKYSSLVAKVEWTGAHGVGGKRKCLPPEGEGYYVEQIVAFDDDQRSYSYAVREGVPAQGMVNSFKVVDLGYQKCMIIWTSSYDQFMENPQMTEDQFLGFLDNAITEMIVNVVQTASKA